MPRRERTQLNINIDPKLLIELKSQAIKNGQTLTEFVIQKLKNSPPDTSPAFSVKLEERLLRIEKALNLDGDLHVNEKGIGTIFTDKGAKNYGEVAKEIFETHLRKKGIDSTVGLRELQTHLTRYPHSNPELVFGILLGTHQLTGAEMTVAYRHGSCAMRSALNDWTNNPLEELNDAFLDAVISKSLA